MTPHVGQGHPTSLAARRCTIIPAHRPQGRGLRAVTAACAQLRKPQNGSWRDGSRSCGSAGAAGAATSPTTRPAARDGRRTRAPSTRRTAAGRTRVRQEGRRRPLPYAARRQRVQRRELPFGLGRQPPPRPAAPRRRLVGVDVLHRRVRLPAAASGRSGAAAIRRRDPSHGRQCAGARREHAASHASPSSSQNSRAAVAAGIDERRELALRHAAARDGERRQRSPVRPALVVPDEAPCGVARRRALRRTSPPGNSRSPPWRPPGRRPVPLRPQ